MIPADRPLICGITAVVLGVLAYHNKTWSPALRAIMTMTALILIVIYAFWLADALIYLLGRVRSAWHYPIIRELELISRMSEAQLAAVGIGTVQLTKLPVNGQLMTSYRVQGLTDDMPLEVVREWADYCTAWAKWPELPALHGFPDNQQRAELRVFTTLAVALKLAEPANGNSPARWRVEADEIYAGLELM